MSLDTAAHAPGAQALEVRPILVGDPLLGPLFDELAHEYSARYGQTPEALAAELTRYPAEDFAPPQGAFLLLLDRGEPVAGGAFRPYAVAHPTDPTGDPTVPSAEVKRVWTHSAHRRRGLGRRVLEELERTARERGYLRLYLTTGPRQPEAVRLYLGAGYTPLFDPDAAPTTGPLPFEKWLES